jgi:hypothetical protein
MSASAISFTYEDRFGQAGEIDLKAMRKLWVDQHRAGVVFAEAAPDGRETLHEVVVDDAATTGAMVAVMESLLAAPALERVESPIDCPALVLEFRTGNPHVVTLAPRSSC